MPIRQVPKPKRHHMHHTKLLSSLLVLVILAIYVGFAFMEPVVAIQPQATKVQLSSAAQSSLLHWPASGQSAVGIVNSSILNDHGAQTAVPTASTAKVITALAVLQKYPLSAGQQGPTITLGDNDLTLYNNYVVEEGSVVPVVSGEQISEYQMLETLMLPSANNMADSLATWAFGSLPAYTAYANNFVKQLGMTNTHIGTDASGFLPSTTSTAHDLVIAGKAAMDNQVLAQIVGQTSAENIPEAGTIKNVNFLLGQDGVIGIKTGNTDQAGGVFISASRITLSGKSVTIVTAVMNSPTLYEALADSVPLITSAQKNFTTATVIQAGSIVANYKPGWAATVPAVASQTLSTLVWRGSTTTASATLEPITSDARQNSVVGSITMPASLLGAQQSVPVKLQASIAKPNIWWRLLHPIH